MNDNLPRLSLGWFAPEVADAIAAALARAVEATEAEQAVRGLDSLDELRLHLVLREGLRAAGYGVHPEARYPSDRGRAKRSEGRRCDLVLTPGRLPLDDEAPQPDLFAAPAACSFEDALWLEVKVVYQHVEGGPNRGYAGEIGAPLFADVRKLDGDPRIRNAALLVVLFSAGREIADHDLDAWESLARRRGLPLDRPARRHLPIADRLGNALCTAALFPIIR